MTYPVAIAKVNSMKKLNDLLDFLNAMPKGDRDAFAKRCGTTFDYLRQVAYGNRLCRESLAINIERESKRKVICESLYPFADWGYLRATKKVVSKKQSEANSTTPNQPA